MLVELFLPEETAKAAPAPPPITAATIAIFAPVDNPDFAAAEAVAGVEAGGVALASNALATVKHPPVVFSVTLETFITRVAMLTTGFVVAMDPVTST